MEITIDITNNFNKVVNYSLFLDWGIMNPVMFFEDPFRIDTHFNFELMNFGLNIYKEIEEELSKYLPNFKDILDCNSSYKSIIIFGRAKFNISNVKGLNLHLYDTPYAYKESRTGLLKKPKTVLSEGLFYEHPCVLKQGDTLIECWANSAFSPHKTRLALVADKNTKVTLTFSSKDYVVKESYDKIHEEYLSKKQTPYTFLEGKPRPDILEICSPDVRPKIFDTDYRNSYFCISEGDNFGGRQFVFNDEI